MPVYKSDATKLAAATAAGIGIGVGATKYFEKRRLRKLEHEQPGVSLKDGTWISADEDSLDDESALYAHSDDNDSTTSSGFNGNIAKNDNFSNTKLWPTRITFVTSFDRLNTPLAKGQVKMFTFKRELFDRENIIYNLQTSWYRRQGRKLLFMQQIENMFDLSYNSRVDPPMLEFNTVSKNHFPFKAIQVQPNWWKKPKFLIGEEKSMVKLHGVRYTNKTSSSFVSICNAFTDLC